MQHAARPPRSPGSFWAPHRAALAILSALLLTPALAAQTLPQLPGTVQEPSSAEAAPMPSATERMASLSTELETARARLGNANEEAAAILAEEVQILERTESVLRQQIATSELIEAERAATKDLREQVAFIERTGLTEPGPYGFLMLESLRDQHQDEEQRLQRLHETVELAKEARDSARKALEGKDRARRQAREAADSQGTPSANALRLARRAELESRYAQEKLLWQQSELERDQAALEAQIERARLAKVKLDLVTPRAELMQEDRDQILNDLTLKETRARDDLEVAVRSRDYATERSIKARNGAESAGGNNPVLLAEVDAHEAERIRRQEEVKAIQERIEGLAKMRELMELRFRVFTDDYERREITVWCKDAEEELADVRRAHQQIQDLMSDVRSTIVTTDAKIEAAKDIEVLRWLRQKRTAETAQVEIFEQRLTFLGEVQRLHQKLLDDAVEERNSFDLLGLLERVWDWILARWTGEIYTVGESVISLKKITLGLTILLLGGFLSKRISRFFTSRILSNFGLNEGALHAFESLSFYLLVITFALFALNVVSIPLTAFTILGGALAIGFGFGSQNIVNNFISGLILLTEQPVRVGDLIQLDESYGTVQHIGLRSTRIRSGDNVEVIVPNSSFLEQNVVNWTLTDTKTRIHVTVGVAYGSNTRKVKDLLKRAATEHGKVLKSPEPLVLFKDFGDNSLVFEVHFWIHMKKLMDRQLLESDIRFRIDSLSREANITIAFPQRDVHLDTLSPLQVRMVAPQGEEEEEDEAPIPPVIP